MQAILERWKSIPREDLFLYWQNELALKNEMRQQLSGYRAVKLENENEFHFLRHSLAYGSHKELFYTIIFLNMDQLQVQSALFNGSAELFLNFLRYLPQLILQEKPHPRNIQFLINIYREDLYPYYLEIVQVLRQSHCDYLLERTANKSLRQLLRNRQAELIKHSAVESYGLIDKLYPEYPGIYGDKVEMITSAIGCIQACAVDHYNRPNQPARLKSLLETADLLFKVGLVGDSLALLLAVYQDWQNQNLTWASEANISAHKAINKILRKTLAMYALLDYYPGAFQKTLAIYQTFFPDLTPDSHALLYLNLYNTLVENRLGNPQHSLVEILQAYHRHENLEVDILFEYLRDLNNKQEEDLILLAQNVSEHLTSSPHKYFVIMEILCFLEQSQVISFSREIASLFLNNYLQLFNWIPNPLFINADILQSLSKKADEKLVTEVEQILRLLNKYSWTELRELYAVNSEFYSGVKNSLEKQLLMGSFLGVF